MSGHVTLIALMMPALALLGAPALAHEGHALPGVMQADYGGVKKSTRELYVELVQEGSVLKIIPTGHEQGTHPVKLEEVSISAMAQLPRAKKQVKLELAPKPATKSLPAHYQTTFDAQGAYRFTLELSVKHGNEKPEKVVFQVEPKR